MLKSWQKSKILAILLFIIVTLQSGHALQTVIPGLNVILYFPVALGVIWMVINVQANKMNSASVMMMLLFVMVAFTFVAYKGSNFSYYLSFLCMIVAAYAVAEMYSFEAVVRWYLRVMTVVAAVALVCYYLVTTMNALTFLPTIKNLNGVTYRSAIIFNYIEEIPERNCGMFWEPGLFATHLTLSMMLELMTKKRPNIFRLVIFSVCIFTANSSAGFVLWFLCLLLFFVKKSRQGALGIGKNILSVLLLIGAIFVITNFDEILTRTALGENQYFQKLSSDSVSSSSRNNAVSHNMEIFSKSPILGAGISYVTKHMAYVADTSTSTYLMSVFGILGVLYTVYWIYGILKLKNVNFLSKLIIAVIILIIVNKEPHHQLLFTWVLLFYFVKSDAFPVIKKKHKIAEDYEE